MAIKSKIILDQIKLHSTKVKYPKGKKGLESTCCPLPFSYPSLYLNTKQAPCLEGKEAGEEVELLVKGKIMSHSINSNQSVDGKKQEKRESHDVQITDIGLVK